MSIAIRYDQKPLRPNKGKRDLTSLDEQTTEQTQKTRKPSSLAFFGGSNPTSQKLQAPKGFQAATPFF